MKKVLFATGVAELDNGILQNLSSNEYECVGYVDYKEALLSKIRSTDPDILVLSEYLQGNGELIDFITSIKENFDNTRVVFLTLYRGIGDSLLRKLVTYNVYDFIASDSWNTYDIAELIQNPRKFSQVKIYLDTPQDEVAKSEPETPKEFTFNKGVNIAKGELTDLTKLNANKPKSAVDEMHKGAYVGYSPVLNAPKDILSSSSRPKKQAAPLPNNPFANIKQYTATPAPQPAPDTSHNKSTTPMATKPTTEAPQQPPVNNSPVSQPKEQSVVTPNTAPDVESIFGNSAPSNVKQFNPDKAKKKEAETTKPTYTTYDSQPKQTIKYGNAETTQQPKEEIKVKSFDRTVKPSPKNEQPVSKPVDKPVNKQENHNTEHQAKQEKPKKKTTKVLVAIHEAEKPNFKLHGIKVALYDKNKKLIAETLTSKNGNAVFENVSLDNEYVFAKELECTDNYLPNDTLIKINLNGENSEYRGTIENKPILVTIKLTNIDKDNNRVKGALFNIYRSDAFNKDKPIMSLRADNNGYAEFNNLKLNDYFIKQMEVDETYILNETVINFNKGDLKNVNKATFVNEKAEVHEPAIIEEPEIEEEVTNKETVSYDEVAVSHEEAKAETQRATKVTDKKETVAKTREDKPSEDTKAKNDNATVEEEAKSTVGGKKGDFEGDPEAILFIGTDYRTSELGLNTAMMLNKTKDKKVLFITTRINFGYMIGERKKLIGTDYEELNILKLDIHTMRDYDVDCYYIEHGGDMIMFINDNKDKYDLVIIETDMHSPYLDAYIFKFIKKLKYKLYVSVFHDKLAFAYVNSNFLKKKLTDFRYKMVIEPFMDGCPSLRVFNKIAGVTALRTFETPVETYQMINNRTVEALVIDDYKESKFYEVYEDIVS